MDSLNYYEITNLTENNVILYTIPVIKSFHKIKSSYERLIFNLTVYVFQI